MNERNMEFDDMGFLKRFQDKMELMGEMFSQTGALEKAQNVGALEQEIRNAVVSCAACKATDECKEWLAEGHDHADAPVFCNNADRIERLKAQA